MRHGMVFTEIKGAVGAVWIGKSTRVGTLTSWVAVPGTEPGTWHFTGRLGDHDAYLVTQGPDSVRLPFGTGELRWSGPLEIAGESVRATFVGPPETR